MRFKSRAPIGVDVIREFNFARLRTRMSVWIRERTRPRRDESNEGRRQPVVVPSCHRNAIMRNESAYWRMFVWQAMHHYGSLLHQLCIVTVADTRRPKFIFIFYYFASMDKQ